MRARTVLAALLALLAWRASSARADDHAEHDDPRAARRVEVALGLGAAASESTGIGGLIDLRFYGYTSPGLALRLDGGTAFALLGPGQGIAWWTIDLGVTGRSELSSEWLSVEWLAGLALGRATHQWSGGLCLDLFEDSDCDTPPDTFTPYDEFVAGPALSASLSLHLAWFFLGPYVDLHGLIGKEGFIPVAGAGLRFGL
ncbi:MAG TPA: hypothetical protein VHM19_02265, partial [Polyangiales bacterium]|nr:hypothetical protein [Polyangiales bacterium]